MASYSRFLGHTVTVNYRVGDILLPASGTFVGDSGRSIFLEQHIEQRGRLNYFRWEIPYQYIHRILDADTISSGDAVPASTPKPQPAPQHAEDSSPRPSTFAAKAGSDASGLLSLSHRPKPA
jgi:hypothetical protein